MTLPTQFLDDLRDRVSLSAVIGRSVRLIKAGADFKACCPFHHEKTPSFTVNDAKGFFHCFGCGAHGDVIEFVRRAHGLSFPDAVAQLAGECGLEVPRGSPEDRAKAQRDASLLELCDKAAGYYESQLWGTSGEKARAYLKKRGISEETTRRFRLGWAPPGNRLLGFMLGEHHTPSALQAAGLIYMNDRGSADVMRGRLIFPISDRRGRIIAFGGRVLDGDDSTAKYLNTPATALFEKSASLYGLAVARKAIVEQKSALVVEGYLDVLACHQAGFEHAVAPLGTAFTEEQAAILWGMAPEVSLCLDGDAAGQAAMERAVHRLAASAAVHRQISFIRLPQGEDPDSVIAGQGAEAFAACLQNGFSLADAIWSLEAKDARSDSPERLIAWEMAILRRIGAIRDDRTRRAYLADFRRRFAGHGPAMPTIFLGASKKRAAPRGDSSPLYKLWDKTKTLAQAGPIQQWLVKHGVAYERLFDHLGGIGLAYGKFIKGRGKIGEEWAMAAPLPLWEEVEGGTGLVLLPAWADQPGGTLLDLVAWDPRAQCLGGMTGCAAVLGQSLIEEARAFQALAIPQKITVTASPLSWLKRTAEGNECVLIVDWRRVWDCLGGFSGLVAEDVETGERLERACRPPRLPRPQIFVENSP